MIDGSLNSVHVPWMDGSSVELEDALEISFISGVDALALRIVLFVGSSKEDV